VATNKTEYLFSVNIHPLPTLTVDPGEEFTVEVRGTFDHIEDIAAVPCGGSGFLDSGIS
jgi:hypothetical protein